MTLRLHFHPLSSFCHKALIALYEMGAAFEPVLVNPSDATSAAAFRQLSPLGKMPALEDRARMRTIWESTIVIEYVDAFYPGPRRLIPADPDRAWTTRMWDRFFDNYVHHPMQRIVADRLRPEERRDRFVVEELKASLLDAYAAAERQFAQHRWAAGDEFGLADCAAAPALFYAHTLEPIPPQSPALRDYLARLMARPSYARVLSEAQPYFRYYPFADELRRSYPALVDAALL